MPGLMAVFWKELSDYFTSRRFLVLLLLVYLSGAMALYTAADNIRSEVTPTTRFVFLMLFTTSGAVLPPFITFLALFIPILGIALGFDTINSERNSGTLTRVLSQPVYRDAFINGKFLAGLATIATLLVSITVVVSGLGLRLLGVPPSLEEMGRIGIFLLLAIIYSGFWLALALLFSLLFSRAATSVLISIAIWLFFTFFMGMVANGLASGLVPVDQYSSAEKLLQHEETIRLIMLFSPSTLFQEGTLGILMPSIRTLGPVLVKQAAYMIPNPLTFSQSLVLVWPQLIGIVMLTICCFAAAYLKFMKEEIRST